MELKAIVIHPIIGEVFEHITEHKKQRRKTMKFIRKKDGEIISRVDFPHQTSLLLRAKTTPTKTYLFLNTKQTK